jgi:hypothetical protein
MATINNYRSIAYIDWWIIIDWFWLLVDELIKNGWADCSHELISTHSRNFEVSGCDLWATADLFGSGSATGDGYGNGFASFGLIANNTGRSGGSCHWFDGVQQLIFENNTW